MSEVFASETSQTWSLLRQELFVQSNQQAKCESPALSLLSSSEGICAPGDTTNLLPTAASIDALNKKSAGHVTRKNAQEALACPTSGRAGHISVTVIPGRPVQ